MSDRKNLSVGIRTPFAGISKEKITRTDSRVNPESCTNFSDQEEKRILDAPGVKPSKSLLGTVKDRFSIIPSQPHPQPGNKKSGIKLEQTKFGSGQKSTVSKEEILKADATIEKFSRTPLPENSLYREESEEPLFTSNSPIGKMLMQSREHVRTSMIRSDNSDINFEFWPASVDGFGGK
jgi:hypothetical protein